MKVGFTGTRKGMTRIQARELAKLLSELKPTEFHHGGCEGADTEASWIAKTLGIFVICHPPTDKKAIGKYFADRVLPEKNYLDRDHDIVDVTGNLIATPKKRMERTRSGTWVTVRHARKKGKPVTIILPDGTVRGEGDN